MQNLMDSWDYIEARYGEEQFSNTPEILELVKELRRRGYDQKLRAGQSITNLRLYRVDEDGLARHEYVLHFEFWEYRQMLETKKQFDANEFIKSETLQMHLSRQVAKHDFKKAKVLLFLNDDPIEIKTEVKYSDEMEGLLKSLLSAAI